MRTIMVLGMHRSGTSALTRVLNLCGAVLPSKLMKAEYAMPGDGNRLAGFWESQTLTDIDDEILTTAGSAWDSLLEPSHSWFESSAAQALTTRLADALREELGDARLTVVKDPRVCRLLPIWRRALAEVGRVPAWVFLIRNPLEVAASLARRDGFVQAKSLLLWLSHLLAAERETRTDPRCFTTFDDLLSDWRGLTNQVQKQLGVALSKPDPATAAEIDSFLQRSLRHHVVDDQELLARENISDWLKAAYRWSLQTAAGDNPKPGQLDEIAQEWQVAVHAFFPLCAATESSLLTTSGRVNELAGEVERLQQEKVTSDQELTSYREEVQRFQLDLGSLRDEVGRISGSVTGELGRLVGQQSEQVERLAAEKGRLSRQIEALSGRLGIVTQDLEARRSEIESMRQTAKAGEQQHKALADELMHANAEREQLRGGLQQRTRCAARLVTRARSLSRTIAAQNRHAANQARTVASLNDQIERLQDELQRTEDLVHCHQQRISAVELALGSRGQRSYACTRSLVGRLRYSKLLIALRLPSWLLTLSWRRQLTRWMDARAILSSGLFDEHYYLNRYQEVAESGIDPVYHYVRYGAAEGRNPNPLFSTSFYLSHNPDVVGSGLNPLVHFIHTGAAEGRATGPEFDTSYYLSHNPDVVESGMNPLRHYIETGIWEGRAGRAPVPTATGLASASKAEMRRLLPELPAPAPPPATEQSRVMPIAFYLPQYHPIPENDEWWGQGFTEWTNVSSARPLFSGHNQPQLPSELGFYDLRLPEVRMRQAELAREHGIHGFCYYYYWFRGREVLEQPLWEMVESGVPDFPFCLCWANENWTRRWDGLDDEILLAQEHDPEGDARFIDAVMPALLDPRYICVDGKPVLLVYRADLLADPPGTAERWHEAAVEAGLPGLHLCAVEFRVHDPRPLGFDALVEFPPHSLYHRGIEKKIAVSSPELKGAVFDYADSAAAVDSRSCADFPIYRGVMPGWDNTPRSRHRALVYHNSSPEVYGEWLERMLRETVARPGDEDQMVFINAWNEWAEGAYLEPSREHGRGYLEATRTAIRMIQPKHTDQHTEKCTDKRTKSKTEPANATWKINREYAASRSPDCRPVLLVSHDSTRAGAQLILLEIIKHLTPHKDLEAYLLLLRSSDDGIEDDFADCAHILNLEKVIAHGSSEEHAIDAIVAGIASRDPLLAVCNTVISSKVGRACHRAGIPVLSMVYELPTSIDFALGQGSLWDVLASSRQIIVASQFVKDQLCRSYGIDPDRLTPLHTGYLPWSSSSDERAQARSQVLDELGLVNDTFLVLGCGSIHKRKGTDLFVQVAREAEEMGSERLCFLWIGDDQSGTTFSSWCKHDINASGLQDRVVLAGPRDRMESYFAAADAFALTSREDPFPMVNLEAMARGVPVVAFAGAGGAPEVLDGDAGIVVPYLDIRAMAKALIKLSEAPQYHARISRNAARKMQSDYQWQRYMDDLMAILSDDFGYRSPTEQPEPASES